MRILLADDERELSDALVAILKHNNYSVDAVYNGEDALAYLQADNYDGAVLDIMMPKMDGLQVLKALREQGISTPALFLTAKTEVDDRIRGLDMGADDYITKPFAMRELMARVKANIRRVDMAPAQSAPPAGETEKRLELGRVSIDLDGATVFKDRKPLDLTQREYELIRFLASQPGKVFSREALMEHVWNYEGYVGDVRAVDVAVRRLREKLEDDPAAPKFILTKRGMGYLFGSQPG